MKNVDVVALGDLILNMVYRGKTEAGFNLYERQPAGATGNLLSQIVRLGGTSALITTVGDDDHGKFLYEYAKESGIDVSGVVISDKVETRMMFVHFDEIMPQTADLEKAVFRLKKLYPGKRLKLRYDQIQQGFCDTYVVL